MCSHHQDDIFRGGSRPKPSLSTATGMGNIPTEPYWQGDFQGSHLPSIAPRGWVRCSTAFPPPWQRFRHQQQINITKQTTTKPTNKPASVWKKQLHNPFSSIIQFLKKHQPNNPALKLWALPLALHFFLWRTPRALFLGMGRSMLP